MILTFILTVIHNFLFGLVGLLPTGTLPTAISSSLTYIVGVMNTFNWFFPLDSLFTVLGIAILFELGVIGFNLLNWVYHKIRP